MFSIGRPFGLRCLAAVLTLCVGPLGVSGCPDERALIESSLNDDTGEGNPIPDGLNADLPDVPGDVSISNDIPADVGDVGDSNVDVSPPDVPDTGDGSSSDTDDGVDGETSLGDVTDVSDDAADGTSQPDIVPDTPVDGGQDTALDLDVGDDGTDADTTEVTPDSDDNGQDATLEADAPLDADDAQDATVDAGNDTPGPDVALDAAPDVPADGDITDIGGPDCVTPLDCDALHGGPPPGVCQAWDCDGGSCTPVTAPAGATCDTSDCYDNQQCQAGACEGGTLNSCEEPCTTEPGCAIPGDTCPAAIVIAPGDLPNSYSGNTQDFTNQYGISDSPAQCQTVQGTDASAGGTTSPEVVYSFTPNITSVYTFSTSTTANNLDSYVTLQAACPMTGPSDCVLADEVSGSGGESISATLMAGTTYYIVIDGWHPVLPVEGPYELNVVMEPLSSQCAAKATDVLFPLPYEGSGDTSGESNTTELLANECSDQFQASSSKIPTASGQAGEHIYRFQAIAAGEFEALLVPTAGDDLGLYVTDTCPMEPSSCLVGSEGTNPYEAVTFNLATNEVVYIVVDGASASDPFEGPYDLIISSTGFEADDTCSDGVDNDADGRTDCEETECDAWSPCDLAENCTDSVDNDNDGATDCDDGSCAGTAACITTCASDVVILSLPYVGTPNLDSNAQSNDYFIPAGTCPKDIIGGTNIYSMGGDGDMLYELTAPTTGDYEFKVTSYNGADHVLAILDSCPADGPISSSECIFAHDGITALSIVAMPLLAGNTYYVLVDNGGFDGGEFDFEVNFLGSELPSQCDDGLDNEGDYRQDCYDPDCFGVVGMCDTEYGPYCGDNLDNDQDGTMDCADPDCFGIAPCQNEGVLPGQCSDDQDNDADGDKDCADPDCAGKDGCPSACVVDYELPFISLEPHTESHDTSGAANKSNLPVDTCNGDIGGRGALAPDHIRFIPDVSGTYLFALTSPTHDHSLYITEGCPPPTASTCLGASHVDGAGGETLSVPLTAFTEYFVVVDGGDNTTTDGGAYTLTVTVF